MPELPEVESTRLTLVPHVVGRRVVEVRSGRRDYALGRGDRAATARELLLDGTITGIKRRGKLMWALAADGRAMAMHLGMSGEMRIVAPGAAIDPAFDGPASHVHVAWTLDDGTRWLFRDPRRFGGVWCAASEAEINERFVRRLGPDGLTVTGDELWGELHVSRRAVKAALLDQSIVAGVGNIYADEALFETQIHPRKFGTRLTREQVERLSAAIRAILAAAVREGGSTLRDYRDASGAPGRAQAAHKAYGRGGEACVRCGAVLKSTTVAQRTTVLCPVCQRR